MLLHGRPGWASSGRAGTTNRDSPHRRMVRRRAADRDPGSGATESTIESTLLTLKRAAPEWAALHRLLVGELLTRGHPSSRLRELAERLQAIPARLKE
ncbi:MAG: hypothetical protein JO115_07145 [Pseudonocardiales bacterium]|nr:hypothetical protein [Pseudonocardiales bacterium]